jgi:SSS family solute:Na+ symporter
VLKWHWWRFNANGFFWGMLAGIVSAMAFSLLVKFGYIPEGQLVFGSRCCLVSLAGSMFGSYATPPTDMAVLQSFYTNVRPWGFWEPVKQIAIAKRPILSAQ